MNKHRESIRKKLDETLEKAMNPINVWKEVCNKEQEPEEKEKGIRFLMKTPKCEYSGELIYRTPGEEIKKHPKYLKALEICKDEKVIDLRNPSKLTEINQDLTKK